MQCGGYLKSSDRKTYIKKELGQLLKKHFTNNEHFTDTDYEKLKFIYKELFGQFHINNDNDMLNEELNEFLDMFKLFGLSSAFKKFQTLEELLEYEEKAVIVFADKFTTCTLNEHLIASKTEDNYLKTKAAEVIEIVKKCNVHSHTRSCRKYSTECRYYFPNIFGKLLYPSQ